MRLPHLRAALTPAVELARTYGARGLARRTLHEALARSGALARLDVAPTGAAPPLRLLAIDRHAAQAVLAREPAAAQAAVERADGILRGRYPYFTDVLVDENWPPRWNHHPRTGVEWRADRHWTAYPHAPDAGDIKWIWEPARFHFAWLFPRAWAVTGDRRFAVETWRGVRDWLAHHPVGRGAGWYCAQELALRCFAVLFAASVFAPEGLVSEEDLAAVGGLMYAAAFRLERTLGHSLSQRNNHALSEAVGLWTMSHVLDGAPEAAGWRARGEAAMLECLADQFASDGAYIQESHNYHRLAVHVLLWAQLVARSFGTSAPGELEGALLRSYTFLDGQRPTAGGELPNYGHNDGALLLALATGTHRDMRPTLQLLAHSLGRPLPFAAGPWDEPAAWLGLGADPRPPAPPPAAGLSLTSSGYLTSRRGAWMVASRVPPARQHRPGQADALHVDLWHGARNLALDPGSYAYSEPPPWQNALAETRVHNTCSAGDRSQMRRRGRFLWTHWSEASLHARDSDATTSMWLASVRCAWGRDLVHTRLVRHAADQVDVLDLVTGTAPDVRRVHWNLDGTSWRRHGDAWHDGTFTVTITADPSATRRTMVADPDATLGWTSPTYGLRVPCTALELETSAPRAWFLTTFSTSPSAPPSLPAAILDLWRAGDVREAYRALAMRYPATT